MAIARNISINSETYELEPSKGQRVYVGTCSTAAATNPKVCTVEDFPVDENGKPYTGTEIVVKFTATNTSTSTTPELNVNGTGAIRIWYNNAVLASAKSAYAGYANRYMRYVYDGTYWVFMGHSVDNNSTYSNVALGQGYAVQNNSAASATITAALGSYALTANGIVSVKFLYNVPANATLNINGKGAKAIYNKDAAITAGVIKAGDTATFIYNTYYHLIAVDSWQDKQDTIDDLATIRSGASKGATAIQQADLAAVATSGSYNDLTNKPTIPSAATATPLMDGTAAVGSSSKYAKEDHVHPSDTSKMSTSHPANSITNAMITGWNNKADKPMIVEIVDWGTYREKSSGFEWTGVELSFSYQEIMSAWNSGRQIYISDGENLYSLVGDPSEGYVSFSSFGWEGSTTQTVIHVHSDNSVLIVTKNDVVKITRTINGHGLSSNITLTSSDVGAVPTTRTVNGKALSSNITLSASDIGALPSSTHIPADQVQSNWNETNTSSKAYIQNKPTIPAAQVNSDWDASSGVAQILNKPTFKTINGESILGSGDIEAGSGDVATAFTITITSTTIEVQPMTGALMTVGTDVSFQVV